ncbi:hypothetical protein [Lysinibacillus fusiformis]|uniref:hypothetical protein n=1 Tax=Lysinibacillus fusiformis TaxID=28031 RepID=UPI003018843A
MEINLKMDFLSDWIEHLTQQLFSLGYTPDESPNKISIQYFNLLKRGVTLTPRRIYFSKEFSCPEGYKEGLRILIHKIEKGESLAAHLSKNINKLEYKDPLLNDWNIHHLHLGTEADKTGFIKRTGPLLFVRFEREEAYFLNTFNHGSWNDLDIVRIIHNNWPQIIDRYRIDAVCSSPAIKTNEQVKEVRKMRSVGFIEPYPGVVYMPIGMGMTTSGHSIEVVRISDFYYDHIKGLEDIVREEFATIVETSENKGIKIISDLKFQLIFKNGTVKAYDKQYNITLDFGELP